jgi:hypothetical protein
MTPHIARARGLAFIALLVMAALVPSRTARALSPTPSQSALCNMPARAGVARHYTVTGRIKLLLIWTGRRDVGAARFVRSDEGDRSRRLELIVGTDPERAPRRLNRWGYIAETSCPAGTAVTGIMTESNEQSLEQAEAGSKGGPREQPLRAIRSRVVASESITELATIVPARVLTYKDVDEALDLMPSVNAPVRTAVPVRAESGFLLAVSALIDESLASYRERRRPGSALRRSYVYGGTVYEMRVDRSHLVRTPSGGSELASDFHVTNSRTGTTTEFQISYAANGARAGVARRIVYRPRWWLELELLLKDPTP